MNAIAKTAAAPKLLVAGHFVRAGRVGGAEPMLYNLLRGFSGLPVETTLLCGDAGHLSGSFLTELAGLPAVRVREHGGDGSRFVAEQRACLSGELAADAILFPNYYVPPLVPRRIGRIGVVMHDFQYRHFPQYFSRKKRLWLRAAQAAAMRLADRVIVISDFVRRDALRLFGDRFADKMRVIPNPLSWERFNAGRGAPRPLAQRYVLSVAAQYPHKNLETLVRAFAVVAARDHDVQLVLCGQSYDGLHGVKGMRSGIGSLIRKLGLASRVRLTGFVDDAALANWFEHAEMFAFPSVFEGFGMPPVEALGFGLAVLTTRATALPEVTMGLAETVGNPYDPGEWAERMRPMLENPERFRPDGAAVRRLRTFYHPERIASAYLQALLG